jgi:16S rRNA (cytidine1402-2'-O)-methyltransferase
VVPLPGPSAVTAALAASGLGSGGFRFLGFLPRTGSARARALELVLRTEEAVVLFESPRRLAETLTDLSRTMPARDAVVAREISKMHEELVRGTVAELDRLSRERSWQGEITLVLGPFRAAVEPSPWDGERLGARIAELVATGLRPKEVARMLSMETGMQVADLYRRICGRSTAG